MSKNDLSLLKFVGGPFDGFSQFVSIESDELPPCVALPLNRQAGRLLGCKVGMLDSSRVAIYRLHCQGGTVRYQFRSMRAPDQTLQPR
jgi:hypothetical protein